MNFFPMQLTLSDWASHCAVIDKIYADGGVHKTVGYWVWNAMGWCRHLGFLLISASSRPQTYSEKSCGLTAELWAHWQVWRPIERGVGWCEENQERLVSVEARGGSNGDRCTERNLLDENWAVSAGLDDGRSFLTLARMVSRLMERWRKEVERQGG